MTRVSLLIAAAAIVGFSGAASAGAPLPGGPPDCEGVNVGSIFGNPVGESGDNFGDLNSNLAQLGFEDAGGDPTAEDNFPNENASARAAWAHRLQDEGVTTSVGDKVAECLD